MPQLTFLNTREVKKIKQVLDNQFGYHFQADYAFVLNERNRLFVVNKDVAKIELKNLRIDKLGLYIGEYKENFLRLSKEGAQVLVREAREHKQKVENLVELSKEEVEKYFKGENVEKDLGEKNRLVILEHNEHIIGCASYKEGNIINFLPKINRGTVIV